MRQHRSPWLEGLCPCRAIDPLSDDEQADVVVVGGGIAGVATAFELLERSDLKVTLLEADRIAHGASGHGSGQVVPAFEGGFSTLSEMFGQELVIAAFRQVVQAGRRFGQMAKAAGASQQVRRVNAYVGFSSIDMVESMVKTSAEGMDLLRPAIKLYAATGSGWNCQLRDIGINAERVPPERLRRMLGAASEDYHAMAVSRTSIANVAAVCSGLVDRMLERHPDRFRLHERTRVMGVRTGKPVTVECDAGRVECKRVVLCTNGYGVPDLSGIKNSLPSDYLKCVTGFMNGYRPLRDGERVGLFFHEAQPSVDEPYVFSTTWGRNGEKTFHMVGGPQVVCGGAGSKEAIDERAHARIDSLSAEIFGIKREPECCWDGLMGYTSSGVRLAGSDPRNPNLFYNLGCNGIGILHSVYGARRIAAEMTGKRIEDSVFEPRHQLTV